MIYTFFVKKDKTHKGDSLVAKLIEFYYTTFVENTDDTIIVSLPGYMSNTKKTIDDFLNKIVFEKKDYVYFTKGMNGNVKAKPTTQTILDIHNNYYSKVPHLSFVNPNTDHSKMIFFLKINGSRDRNNNLIYRDATGFSIKAVLIGSSNQSFATYFGPTYDKGEADFLIIDSYCEKGGRFKNDREIESQLSSFVGNNIKELGGKIVLSRQMCFSNCETLNDIFGNYIANCAIKN